MSLHTQSPIHEVRNNDKSDGLCYVKIDIYFSAVGVIDVPTAEEIKKDPPTILLCGIKRENGATPYGVTPYLHRDYFLMGLLQTSPLLKLF